MEHLQMNQILAFNNPLGADMALSKLTKPTHKQESSSYYAAAANM